MNNKVQTAARFIQNNLHRNLRLNELAQIVNLSSSRFRHLFKSETGLSPSQYIKLLRMQKAKSLAETTFLTEKEIMVEIGVNDESHFVRDFKKSFGLTPIQHRASYLAQDDSKGKVQKQDSHFRQ